MIKKNSYSITQGNQGNANFIDITFNKKKNTAEVYWGVGVGFLQGHGSHIEFTKENNKWRKSNEYGYWIS